MLYTAPILLSAYYFGGKLLRNVLIDQLNQQLNVQAKVYSIQLNGLQTFPQLGIELTNVRINESSVHYEKYLLQAKKIVVIFNPITFFTGKNEIERIEIDGGAARLFVGKDGHTNFELFKPDDDSSDNAIHLDLKKVHLTNFQCVYLDEKEDQSFNFETKNLEFSGKFDEERYTLKTNGDALFDHLMLNGKDYIVGKRCQMDLVLDVNQKIESYHVEKGIIGIDDLLLNVEGDILLTGNEPNLDLQFTGNNIDIQSVLSVMPNDISYRLRQLQSNGQIDVTGEIVGSFKENSWPKIDMAFAFKDASIDWKEKDLSIKKINLTGSLNNLKSDQTTKLDLNVDIEEVQLQKSSIKGRLTILDVNHPDIDFSLKGLIDLSDIAGLVIASPDQDLFGRFLFNLQGGIPYDHTRNTSDFAHSTMDGDIELKDVNYREEKAVYIKDLTAKTRVKGNALTRLELDGELWKNDVSFKGIVNNWQGYLFKDQRLEIEGDLKSKYVNLNFNQGEEQKPPSEEPEKVSIDFGFDALVTLSLDTFDWGMVSAKNVTGKLNWTRSKMVFNNLAFDAWHGSNQLDGELIETQDTFYLNTNSYSENVQIGHLLDDFDNFSQTEFTSDNLNGTLTTTIDLKMKFDRYFDVIEDEVKCLADLNISNGRLKNYQPMEALSSFVELDDLQDIRFEELHNIIEIQDREIDIPTMAIKNNAMNLDIGGTHSFDNFMNYRLKIRITELLAKKSGWIKRKKERQLEDDKGGGLSAYILMVGPPNDLKIKYDRKAVKETIKKEIKKERKEFFQELKREIKREKTPTDDTKKVEWDE